jgi:hypothetical protein
MSNSTSNQSIEDKLYAATRMPLPRPEFLSGLQARLVDERPDSMKLADRLKMAFARTSKLIALAVVLFLITGFVALGPQRVIATVRGLIGYIPGLGFVEDTETARILAQPVSITRDGVTMTVENAVADFKSTRIILRVDGFANAHQLFFPPDSETPTGPQHLVLPNGSELALQSWSVRVDASSLTFLLLYSPLPENTLDAVLVFDPISSSSTGKAPQAWQIPLHFRSGHISEQILAAMPVTLSSQEQQGITLVLESVVQTPGMAALKVRLNTEDAAVTPGPNWANNLKLIDKNGSSHILSVTSTLDQNGFDAAVLQTPILEPGAQYTLRLQGPLEVFKYVSAQETRNRFTLGLGPNPQPGQSWKLDQTIVAAGQTFHLSGAHLLSGNACGSANQVDGVMASLVFDFDPHPATSSLIVIPLDPSPGTRFYDECLAYKSSPSGLTEFRIGSYSLQVEGTWEIKWQVPVQ